MRRFTLLAAILAAAAAALGAPAGCAGTTPCQLNSDCPFGYCQNGQCQKMCVDASRDCPPGYSCDQNAQCVPGGGGSDGGTSSSSSSTTSSTGSSGTTTSTSSSGASSSSSSSSASSTSSGSSTSSTSSSSGGPMNLHELDPCTSNGQCASPLVCKPMTQGGASRCTRLCSSNTDCMTGTVCDTISSATYCAFDDTGLPCSSASNCNFGCLGTYCTVACNTGADCPNGYGCTGVGNPAVRVCVQAEAICSTTDTSACLGSLFCDVTPQMVVGGCTTACTTASDCPQRAAGLSPWTCDVASGGLCRRPPDVYGPLPTAFTPAQYACNVSSMEVNVCNDAQHIDFVAFDVPTPPSVTCGASTTTPGIATDSCVDSCTYQGGCPFGNACVAVGSINGNRIGLCLPVGAGEVGSSCAHDGDCVFGFCPSSTMKCSRDCSADGVCPGGTTCTAGGGPPVEGLPFRRCQ
jgi:hypothetical protein